MCYIFDGSQLGREQIVEELMLKNKLKYSALLFYRKLGELPLPSYEGEMKNQYFSNLFTNKSLKIWLCI